MTPDGEFREAVARLHRAKDAVYRDAWKRRGEVISILANIARKVDRLEYGLDGAPATAGESWLDTAVDLLVYCLKYQAYLADLHSGTAARLFGGSGFRPPYSDVPAGFEVLLPRADQHPAGAGPARPPDRADRRRCRARGHVQARVRADVRRVDQLVPGDGR